jgi:hypothetical protein
MTYEKRIPEIFKGLLQVSGEFTSGARGVDFLVLNDDDEMKGYSTTDLEGRFAVLVKEILAITEEHGMGTLIGAPEIIGIGLQVLVQVQPAVDAYRSRLFSCATDWGSEVSPVGSWSNRLLDLLREALAEVSSEKRKSLFKQLPKHVRQGTVERIWWKEWDRHDSYYLSIESILLEEKKAST